MKNSKLEKEYLFFLLFSFLFLYVAILTKGSFGWDGNHATYLIGGIVDTNPAFLENDWWTNTVAHYHFAFNMIVSIGSKLNVLVSLLDSLTVLVFLCVFLIIYKIARELSSTSHFSALMSFLTVVVFYLITNGFMTVGDSYILSNMIQASSIAMLFSLLGYLLILRGSFLIAGIALFGAGLLHVNFLILNIAVIGLMLLLEYVYYRLALIATIKKFLLILGPSLLLMSVLVPYILGLSISSDLTPEEQKLASYVFFDLAVPIHYSTKTFLIGFIKLGALHILTLSSLYVLIHTTQKGIYKRFLFLNLSLIILLWSAFILTTVVFIEPIAKLFFWRLAPISELFGLLVFFIVIYQLFTRNLVIESTKLKIGFCTVTAVCFLGVLRTQLYYNEATKPEFMAYFILAVVSLLYLSSMIINKQLFIKEQNTLVKMLLITLLVIPIITFANLQHELEIEKYKKRQPARDLFAWVSQNTKKSDSFAIPIYLSTFRLFTDRAVIVEYKNLPFGMKNQLLWLERLEDISGVELPQSLDAIDIGYKKIEQPRLNFLNQKYGIAYAVLYAESDIDLTEWTRVYENEKYTVVKKLKIDES